MGSGNNRDEREPKCAQEKMILYQVLGKYSKKKEMKAKGGEEPREPK